MSGEQDIRPTLSEQIKALRDRLQELERRVSGDDIPLDLSDLNDVRVDSLGDATITLADGSALVYRAADELWVPGTAGASSFPITYSDGTTTYTVDANSVIDELRLETVLNAGSVVQSRVRLFDNGGIEFDDPQGGGVYFSGQGAGGFFIVQDDGGGVFIEENGGGGIFIDETGGGGIGIESTGSIALVDDTEIILDAPETFFKNANSAPTSADLDVGWFGFWYDPATSVLQAVARDSGGTIRTLNVGTLT